MARTFRNSPWVRLLNVLATLAVRSGIGSRHWYLLTVRGRRSGRPYTTPVSLVTVDGRRWLVSPYGRRGWAANVLPSGEVLLRHGRELRRARVTEVPPARAAPVLRAYLRQEPTARPYFDVGADSSDAELAREAPRHPVFALEGAEWQA